ncbi:SDR family oxidoreductase [Candidatus Kaiserbacteria bacterium]|nr:SDR family oxidoreductase [Candidatus Kaiserbacteria bacterium]
MMNINGQRFVITGAANEKSICWGIARQAARYGAEVILTCQSRAVDKLKRLGEAENISHVYSLDYFDPENPQSVDQCFELLAPHAPIHGFVHGIAGTGQDGLKKPYSETSLENFNATLALSCWTFINMSKRMKNLMTEGGSILTLSFDAAHGVYEGYGIMGTAKSALEDAVKNLAKEFGPLGIRVNGISPSPEKTVSAMGVPGNRAIGAIAEATSFLGGRASMEEIGDAAVFFLSPMSAGTTGEVLRIDRGSGAAKMPLAQNIDRPAGNVRLGEYLIAKIREARIEEEK